VLDQGRLVQVGTPRDIYENPVSTYVASRLGLPRINLLPADMFANPPARATQIGLRPEHIALSSARDDAAGVEATITRLEHLGDQTRLHLVCAGHPIVTLTDPHSPLRAGETVRLQPRSPLYFDAQGDRIP
jgi:multiple sugar transport system ATP-binding protein